MRKVKIVETEVTVSEGLPEGEAEEGNGWPD
jgi:hypothetical protein